MQIREIHELLELLKTKGMQVELFERPRKYAVVHYNITNSNGKILRSEEMLAADFDEVIFAKYLKELRRKQEFVSRIETSCIQKISETYLLKDAKGIQISWFDLEEGRKGIADATRALRSACLKYGVKFAPDMPSDEPFPHNNDKQNKKKRAKLYKPT